MEKRIGCVAFDGKRAMNNMTGLGNYSRLVVELLAQRLPETELRLYVGRMRENPRLQKIVGMPNVRFVLPSSRMPQALWRTFGITGQLRDSITTGITTKGNSQSDEIRMGLAVPELYHGLSNELPLNIAKAGIPSVVTIHDVIYRRLPDCYNLPDRILYDFKYGRSARAATRVIAVSERTKLDVMEYYGIPEEKIDVVYQGCDPSFLQPVSEERKQELRKRLNLPKKFLVQVGTIESRKNLELSVRALSAISSDIHLVAVGRDRKGYLTKVNAIARESGVSDRLHIIPGLAFSDLPALYHCAEVSLYPSLYEGFGIPVIEAISCGRPVVAATGSCLEEAGGKGAVYVNPDDPRELATTIRTILDSPRLREKLTEEGEKHIARFSREAQTEGILKTYINAVEIYKNSSL